MFCWIDGTEVLLLLHGQKVHFGPEFLYFSRYGRYHEQILSYFNKSAKY